MALIEGEYTCDICGETFETNVAIASHTQVHESGATEEEVLNAIRDVAEQLGRVPTSKEFNRNAPISTTLVTAEFESWNAAVNAAGFEPRTVYKSDEEILAKIKEIAAKLGRVPAHSDWVVEGQVAASTVENRFGSWNNAIAAAGFEPRRQKQLQSEDVLDAIHSLASELGRAQRPRRWTNRVQSLSRSHNSSSRVGMLRFGKRAMSRTQYVTFRTKHYRQRSTGWSMNSVMFRPLSNYSSKGAIHSRRISDDGGRGKTPSRLQGMTIAAR